MYIKKYWGNFITGLGDSHNLVAFLDEQEEGEISMGEIFVKIGLDRQNWDFRTTGESIKFTNSDGVSIKFNFAINVVSDLAVILLESSRSGSVNLRELSESLEYSKCIKVTATPEERMALERAMADFVCDPLGYDISEKMGEDEITDMAYQVEMVRQELHGG